MFSNCQLFFSNSIRNLAQSFGHVICHLVHINNGFPFSSSKNAVWCILASPIPPREKKNVIHLETCHHGPDSYLSQSWNLGQYVHLHDDKAVQTEANLYSRPPLPRAIPWCMEIKVHIWLKLLIIHWLGAHEKKTPQLTSLSQNDTVYFYFIFFNLWVKCLKSIIILNSDRCSMQRHRREPISMTQPALSSVSTKLRAHLLPVGHR